MGKYTWLEFENEWGAKFDNVYHILSYINSFPKSKLNLLGFRFESNEKILEVQKEWLWLLNNLTHHDDTLFFKPYWIPIEKESNSYFLDISSENYSLFKVQFSLFEMNWYKIFYTNSINELLIGLSDSDEKIKQFRLRSLDENQEILDMQEKKFTDKNN